jgi:hypothetical protein
LPNRNEYGTHGRKVSRGGDPVQPRTLGFNWIRRPPENWSSAEGARES